MIGSVLPFSAQINAGVWTVGDGHSNGVSEGWMALKDMPCRTAASTRVWMLHYWIPYAGLYGVSLGVDEVDYVQRDPGQILTTERLLWLLRTELKSYCGDLVGGQHPFGCTTTAPALLSSLCGVLCGKSELWKMASSAAE